VHQHADDLARQAIDDDVAADHGGVSPELVAPETVGQHGGERGAGCGVRGVKEPGTGPVSGQAPAYAGPNFIIARDRPDCRRLSLFRQATQSY